MFDKLRHYRVSVKPSTNVCATLMTSFTRISCSEQGGCEKRDSLE